MVRRRMPTAEAGGVGSTAGFGLPRNLLEKARDRVKVVVLLTLSGAAFSLMVRLALASASEGISRTEFIGIAYAGIVAVVAALFYGAACAKGLEPVHILSAGLIFEVFLCFSISVGNVWQIYSTYGYLPFLTWATPIVILFPLIIPSPPRLTLMTAWVAGTSAPLSVLFLSLGGAVSAAPSDYVWVSISPIIAIAVAYFGSRVVYGFNLDIARAQQIGSYHLESLLGEGAMGQVWKAKHRMLARPAAIKLIRPETLGVGDIAPEVTLRRFEREAQATAMLRSPHTIQLYDFGVSDEGTFYYVMELLDGVDLERLVRTHGPLPVGRTVRILRQVCHSLNEAHQSGMVHRDIKPANILLCRYGGDMDFVKVLDFGLVKRSLTGDAKEVLLTTVGSFTGTPAYASPEMADGDADKIDARSDIYALGCVSFWLLTGRHVFEASSMLDMLIKHRTEAADLPSKFSDFDIPAELDAIILSCLEKDPSKRIASVAELSTRLQEVEGSFPWDPHQSLSWWEALRPGESEGLAAIGGSAESDAHEDLFITKSY